MKNDRGLTLVEVLTVVALLSMILLLAGSIHLFSQKQLRNQKSEIDNQTNIRIALNLIKKEIRSAQTVEITNNVLTINDTVEYKLEDHFLKKNNEPLIANIRRFDLQKSDGKIDVTIESVRTWHTRSTTMSAAIYLRK